MDASRTSNPHHRRNQLRAEENVVMIIYVMIIYIYVCVLLMQGAAYLTLRGVQIDGDALKKALHIAHDLNIIFISMH